MDVDRGRQSGAATRLLQDFDDVALMLSRFPRAGVAREDLAASLRAFPVGSYLLFYRPVHDGIEVVRIPHGRRDIDASYF